MKIPSGRSQAVFSTVVCAAFAFQLASALLWAQTSGAPANPPNAYDYFTYPGFELWNPAKWAGNKAKAAPVATWITSHQKQIHSDYTIKDKYKGINDFVGHPDYN